MANPYILRYSNPFKSERIYVPDAITGTGKNDYDTSLSFVGPGYTNYGLAFAQNFLQLLENFAGPYPPENPIEVQICYDTSDVNKKILRVNNGGDTSSRWPSANGIYQQTNDPFLQYEEAVVEGDIWVDTQNSQIKIRYGSTWRLVGPTIGIDFNKTGSEAIEIESNQNDTAGKPIKFPVILNWVNGKVVEIISLNVFIPRQIIEGFSSISTGTNLSSRNNAKFHGIVEKAEGLLVGSSGVLRSTDFLRNKVLTRQIHTGSFTIIGADGLSIKNALYPGEIQLYSNVQGGNINFNDDNKSFTIGIANNSYLYFDSLDISNPKIGINTVTTSLSPSLDVGGSGRFKDNLTILSTSSGSFVTSGSSVVLKNQSIYGNLFVQGTTTQTGRLIVGNQLSQGLIIDPAKNDSFDIGSAGRRFRHIFASAFGNTSSVQALFYGNLKGAADKLSVPRNFYLSGQVSATNSLKFDGTSDVHFTATLHRSAIANQISYTGGALGQYSLIVLNTNIADSQIERITKEAFVADLTDKLVPVGTILPYGKNNTSSFAVSGSIPTFLLCDGTIYSSATNYQALYNVIQRNYTSSTIAPPNFQVPNFTQQSPASSVSPAGTIYYIIKT
jgi:hypothetical protein